MLEPNTSANLEILLLGGLQVRYDGAVVGNFISSKAPALLAYLAVTGRPHQREALAGLLWGEMADAAAANNLRQILSNLRKLLDPYLVINRDTVAFNRDLPYLLDTEAFAELLHRRRGQPADQRAELLHQALALYQGEFLHGFYVRDAPDFEEWALVERVRLRNQALTSLDALTQLLIARGDYHDAADTANRLLALDPWREETHRQLMLLHARMSHWSAALAQYDACRRTLEQELGVQPALETTGLYERIRAARQSRRHNIVAAATSLVGRERELADVRRRLASPDCRLLTLTGLGGTGKTRLAQEVARACSDMFINGAWMAALADVEAEGLVPALGSLFDFPFTKGDHQKQLLNFLRQKELLLVLDSFEHLLDASRLLTEILQFAPEVKLLVTSRERLDIEGEWVVEVGGLDMPHEANRVAVESSGAVQFFVQCAQRVRPGTEFDEPEQAAIVEICRLVGGLPLGIEIAAARTRTMSCAGIAADIRQGLDVLASTRRDMPQRQRSLRAVFESSWARLAPVEQQTLAALSVFRGGFTVVAAGRVAGTLAPLVDKSLVQRNGERFQLHQVLQQFAAEKLDVADPARQAHTSYFADWIAACAQMDERQAFVRLADELENVRAAWLWGCQQQDTPALTAMAPLLKRYLEVQGRYSEGLTLSRHALAAYDAPANADNLPPDRRGSLVAQLMMARALFLGSTGHPAAAIPVLTSCLAYFQRTADPEQAMICQNLLGKSYGFFGQPDQAAACFRAYLEAARALDNPREVATALNNLATALTTLGQTQEAELLLRECLALRRSLDDDPGLSSTLINLSVALFNQGRYAEEKPLLAEAIEISRRINQPRNLAGALGNLGTILLHEGQHAAALKLFQQGLEIHRNSGYRYGTTIALDNVGTAHYHLSNEREARYYLHQAIAEARAIGADFVALDAAVWLAGLAARENNQELALAWLSMIRRHPQTDQETVHSLEQLLPQVLAGLSPRTVQAAEARGERLTLDDLWSDGL